jgi:hypothetical protein
MIHKGSLLVTGTAMVIIPIRSKPSEADAWFDPSCDISLPHSCAVVCENDRVSSNIIQIEPHNNLGPRYWGIRIKWHIYDHRTRQIYWTTETSSCSTESHDDLITEQVGSGDFVLNEKH